MLIEESLEGRVSVFKRVMFAQEFIIMGSLVPVREDLKGFSNLMKLGLSRFPVFLVFVRVPFGGQFFVGVLDFEERGVFGNPENGIIVLQLLSTHS